MSGRDAVASFAVDLLVEMDQHAVLKCGDTCRFHELAIFENRGGEEDVETLPLTGFAADVHQWRSLAIDGSALAVGIEFDVGVGGVEDLDFKLIHQGDAVVSGSIPWSLEIDGCHPLDVDLNIAESRFGRELSITGDDHAVLHFPFRGLPGGEILAIEQHHCV